MPVARTVQSLSVGLYRFRASPWPPGPRRIGRGVCFPAPLRAFGRFLRNDCPAPGLWQRFCPSLNGLHERRPAPLPGLDDDNRTGTETDEPMNEKAFCRSSRGTALLAMGALLLAGCAMGRTSPEAEPDREAVIEAAREAPVDTAGAPDPASDEYRIGPDDMLDIRVYGAPDLSSETRVTQAGRISMPLLGPVEAAGRTTRELEEHLEDLLRDSYMWDPRVGVQVLEARSEVGAVVYVIGDVRRPGGFPLERGEPISVIQALALAEGLAPTAARDRARIIRPTEDGSEHEVAVNLDRILEGSAHDPSLGHRDILFVPNSRPKSILRGAWDAFLRIFTFRGILY